VSQKDAEIARVQKLDEQRAALKKQQAFLISFGFEDGLEDEVTSALDDQEQRILKEHLGPQIGGDDAATTERKERMRQREVAENARIAGEDLRDQLRRKYQPQIDDLVAEESLIGEKVRVSAAQLSEAQTRWLNLVHQQEDSLTDLQAKQDEVRRLLQELPGLEENHRYLRSMKAVLLKATVSKFVKNCRARRTLAELLRKLSGQVHTLLGEAQKENGPGTLELETRLQTEVGVWWERCTHLLLCYDMHKSPELKQKAVVQGLEHPNVMDFLDNIRDAQQVLSLMIQQLINHNNHMRATHMSFDVRNDSLATHCQRSSLSITRASQRTKELSILIDQARAKRYKLTEDYKRLQSTYDELKSWISSSGSNTNNKQQLDHEELIEKRALKLAEKESGKKRKTRKIKNTFGYKSGARVVKEELDEWAKIDKRITQWAENMTRADAKAHRDLLSSGKSYTVQPYRVASAERSMTQRMRTKRASVSNTNLLEQQRRPQTARLQTSEGKLNILPPKSARPQSAQHRIDADAEKRFRQLREQSPFGQKQARPPTAPPLRQGSPSAVLPAALDRRRVKSAGVRATHGTQPLQLVRRAAPIDFIATSAVPDAIN
jgi:hypothetical protein